MIFCISEAQSTSKLYDAIYPILSAMSASSFIVPPRSPSILKRPERFPHTVNLLQASIMSGNTVNPNQIFNMMNSANENQMYDPSLADGIDLDDFDFEGFNADTFGQNSGLVNSNLGGPAMATSMFDNVDYSRQPQGMMPMPQSLNPSPATMAPPQGLNAMPAGMAYYHPAVGYYIPLPNAQVPGFPGPGALGTAPSFAAPPVPMFSQAPIAPIASVAPFGTALPDMTAKVPQAKRAPASNKRKYGPKVFLEERDQAKRRAIGDGNSPLPVSRDLYSSEPTEKKRNASKAAGAMKELNTATVMRCRCEPATGAKEPHIPRPRNHFIIFRGDISSRYRTSRDTKRGISNPNISKVAGDLWKALGPEGQAPYKLRAAREKAEHRRQYPNYHYTPMKKIQARFGDEGCTCGAYEMNMAELKRLREGGATPPNNFMGANETDNDEGEYTALRTRSVSRANSIQAPTAQTAPWDFDVDAPGFDFSLEDNMNVDDWAAIQDFNNATPDVSVEQQPAQRRSSRSGKKVVHYADDADQEQEEVTTTTATQKHRPPPISTSRKSSNSSQLSAPNSADFKIDDGNASVASRTRSKSVSPSAEEMAQPTRNSSFSSLFGDDESDVGDNIVVATPKPSPKHNALALPPRITRQTRSQSRGRERRRS